MTPRSNTYQESHTSEGTIVSPTVIFSSSRSSCRDDALVYIWSGSPTHFFARWIGPFSGSNLSNLYWCICLCICNFFVEVIFPHHSDQMSQRSQVSRIALCRCFWHFITGCICVFVLVFVFFWSGRKVLVMAFRTSYCSLQVFLALQSKNLTEDPPTHCLNLPIFFNHHNQFSRSTEEYYLLTIFIRPR